MASTTDIAVAVAATPAIVFSDPKAADDLFAHIAAEIAAHKPDLTTETGRKAIASLAYKIARTKTAIDEAGSELADAARKQVATVDAERRRFRARLDDLRDTAREPLTEWEAAEKARVARVEAEKDSLRRAGVVVQGDTAAAVKRWRRELSLKTLDPAVWQDDIEIGRQLLTAAIASIDAAIERLMREEAERAELERLRAEKAERDAAEAARAALEAAEERRRQAEADEQRRLQRAADEAQERAMERARQAAEAKEREHKAEIARVKDEADARERQRAADAAAAAAQQRARERDQAHRKQVTDEAAAALMANTGMSQRTADKVVQLIAAGAITNVKMEF